MRVLQEIAEPAFFGFRQEGVGVSLFDVLPRENLTLLRIGKDIQLENGRIAMLIKIGAKSGEIAFA